MPISNSAASLARCERLSMTKIPGLSYPAWQVRWTFVAVRSWLMRFEILSGGLMIPLSKKRSAVGLPKHQVPEDGGEG